MKPLETLIDDTATLYGELHQAIALLHRAHAEFDRLDGMRKTANRRRAQEAASIAIVRARSLITHIANQLRIINHDLEPHIVAAVSPRRVAEKVE